MVGALSIVRFRTAIKDPMDLAFLFWSISIGIICGAGLYEIALVTSVGVTVFILVLDMLPVGKAPMMLVVNSSEMNGRKSGSGCGRKICPLLQSKIQKPV